MPDKRGENQFFFTFPCRAVIVLMTLTPQLCTKVRGIASNATDVLHQLQMGTVSQAIKDIKKVFGVFIDMRHYIYIYMCVLSIYIERDLRNSDRPLNRSTIPMWLCVSVTVVGVGVVSGRWKTADERRKEEELTQLRKGRERETEEEVRGD